MASLVIFDFDGTLFDTHESISQTIKLTFDTLLPAHTPPRDEIHRLIASGSGLTETFKTLHPSPAEFAPTIESEWVGKYRSLYATHGQPLIKAFPGAKELLTKINSLGIPISIISNKGVEAVKTALKRNNLDSLVPEDLIIGDNTPGAKRKPDPSSFTNVLAPALEKAGTQIVASQVLVVGDTIADIEFARNIGSTVCWCRYGYGDREACQALGPDFVIDALENVAGHLSN